MPTPESTIQINVFLWIKNNENSYDVLKTIYHTPNSFFGTNFGVIQHLRKMGMRKGIYDLIIPISTEKYSSLWIEIKAKKGKLSDEQKTIAELINKHSTLPTKFITAYDEETAIKAIKDYLQL
jgi:hypothetical protein